jgi:hypothetical protein
MIDDTTAQQVTLPPNGPHCAVCGAIYTDRETIDGAMVCTDPGPCRARMAKDLPHPTGKPWMPWLRPGGLTDGDKVLIAIAPILAETIIEAVDYMKSEGQPRHGMLTTMYSFLHEIGASDAN